MCHLGFLFGLGIFCGDVLLAGLFWGFFCPFTHLVVFIPLFSFVKPVYTDF